MSPSYNNEFEYMLALYRSGKGFPEAVYALRYSAKTLYEKSAISKNLQEAKRLSFRFQRLKTRSAFEPTDNPRGHMLAYVELNKCFEMVVDDLLLVAAYEQFAKARLLSKSYVVHEIEEPRWLRNVQKKGPVHVRQIRQAEDAGEIVRIKPTTIGINVLVSPGYKASLRPPKIVESGLSELKIRRNRIHFTLAFWGGITPGFLALAEYLHKNLSTLKR